MQYTGTPVPSSFPHPKPSAELVEVENASPSFPFSLPIVASVMSHAGGSSVCCVRARLQRVPRRQAGGTAEGQGRGSGVSADLLGSTGLSRSRVTLRCLGFAELMG